MDKPYFVMMYNQARTLAMPIIDSSDEDGERVMFWATEDAARDDMNGHEIATALGYEVFSMEEPL